MICQWVNDIIIQFYVIYGFTPRLRAPAVCCCCVSNSLGSLNLQRGFGFRTEKTCVCACVCVTYGKHTYATAYSSKVPGRMLPRWRQCLPGSPGGGGSITRVQALNGTILRKRKTNETKTWKHDVIQSLGEKNPTTFLKRILSVGSLGFIYSSGASFLKSNCMFALKWQMAFPLRFSHYLY